MSIRKVEIQGMVDGDFRRIHGIGEQTDMPQINRCVYVYKTLKIISTQFTISCNGRFQGVSKLWLSIIRSKDYNFVFSAPEHQNVEDDKPSTTVIGRHDITISDLPYHCMKDEMVGAVYYGIWSYKDS
ncbi:hypothetical protein IGI04_028390 [Brassica rapa subsp. trilocularis]|uniref:Jacalin-type lectin domain-containing protein n=1 Tax=Brassica rapa subsp. trilocularis TaxID=1813537 RepID=A0ABQ7L572_BRACM|nr:hypothetical protein IGI04_028390 [Brassica rapa subsp. trilocularis]